MGWVYSCDKDYWPVIGPEDALARDLYWEANLKPICDKIMNEAKIRKPNPEFIEYLDFIKISGTKSDIVVTGLMKFGNGRQIESSAYGYWDNEDKYIVLEKFTMDGWERGEDDDRYYYSEKRSEFLLKNPCKILLKLETNKIILDTIKINEDCKKNGIFNIQNENKNEFEIEYKEVGGEVVKVAF